MINTPLEIKAEYTPCRSQDYITWGYDWIDNEHYTERVESFRHAVDNPFSHGFTPLNKGTLHTLQMLIDAQDEEERAAIWIYAFCHDLTDKHYGMKSYGICGQLENAAFLFLKERFDIWHHAMKKLTPEYYIPASVLYEAEFEEHVSVVELIILNTYLIRKEYSVVLYHSLETTDSPFDHYSLHVEKESEHST